MNKKNINQLQQGDVCLLRLCELPKGEIKIVSTRRCVLAHGESGHSHIIEDDGAELIQIGERMLLTLKNKATLIHEEHKPITLSPGIWEIGQVIEKDWFTDMISAVKD